MFAKTDLLLLSIITNTDHVNLYLFIILFYLFNLISYSHIN